MNKCNECGTKMPEDFKGPACSQECLDNYMDGMSEEFDMNDEKLKELANEEYNNTLASYSESGRDMELCHPSIEEEEREAFLVAVTEGDEESMATYREEQSDKKMKEVE